MRPQSIWFWGSDWSGMVRLTQQARHSGSVEPWGKSQLQPAAVSKLAQRW